MFKLAPAQAPWGPSAAILVRRMAMYGQIVSTVQESAESTSYLVSVYAAYGVASVGLTVGLARTLFKNGAVFLEDVFKDNRGMAEAVNRLLVVGFYLLNFGYACL